MENQPSVKQPQSLFQSSGNHSQQELFNFTKSVIDLEAVICHKSREPNQIVIQEKSPPRTLNKPQGADGFASKEYHANLKQSGNVEHFSDELVISRQRVFESPLKKPSPEVGNENGPNQAIRNEPFFRNESESQKICDIHLSRVYFSQHSTDGKQAFQEAQTPDFQPISETLSRSEEAASRKRKVQFDETAVMPWTSPTAENTKHLRYPNHSSSKKQYIKGLFQKPSKPVNFSHRKRTLSDKYVYFLSDCGRSSTDSEKADCPRLNQYFISNLNVKQPNDNERDLTKPRKRRKKEEIYANRESNDASRMQVVVDDDGRVLVNVLHDSKDNQKTSKKQHNLQTPPAGGKNNHDQHICSKEPLCQAASPGTKQTKHIYAKMKVDGSFLEIGDSAQLHEMTCKQQARLYSKGHGKNMHVLRQDEAFIERNPTLVHYVSPSCARNEIKHDYRYQCRPIIETLPTSHGRQPPRTVYSTVMNTNNHHQQNTRQNSTSSLQNCYQPKLHSPISDRRATSCPKRTSNSTLHQGTAPKREPKKQTTNQPIGNTSQMENVKDVPPHQDNARQSNAAQPNSDSDRRYRCDWPACTKAFRHYSFLVLHRRIHTGERPYNCSWQGCKKQFRRSDDYQRHYRVHTGVKPYPCSVCGKAFKRSDHRLFHYRAIHNMYKQ